MNRHGKIIMITGCSSGIGEYCAIQLHMAGWQVYATARNPEDIQKLEDRGIRALYLDYCDEASIKLAFETVLEETGGRIDALFNNGAYGQAGAVEDISTQTLRQQFDANFFGWHELTNLAVAVMRRQGHGRIIHCSSVLGFVPFPWRGAYNASKFALEGLASTMRLELSGSGIHICLIEPGPIESKFGENGVRHFIEKIDIENSVHKDEYKHQLQRLGSDGGVNRFRLGPDAVYEKLRHCLEARSPKAHYPITLPTWLMSAAVRILPVSWLDKILIKNR